MASMLLQIVLCILQSLYHLCAPCDFFSPKKSSLLKANNAGETNSGPLLYCHPEGWKQIMLPSRCLKNKGKDPTLHQLTGIAEWFDLLSAGTNDAN